MTFSEYLAKVQGAVFREYLSARTFGDLLGVCDVRGWRGELIKERASQRQREAADLSAHERIMRGLPY